MAFCVSITLSPADLYIKVKSRRFNCLVRITNSEAEKCYSNEVIMADPARIKVDSTPERPPFSNDENPDVKPEESEAGSTTQKPSEENKESSSQDQPKQELKPVSRAETNELTLQIPYCSFVSGF